MIIIPKVREGLCITSHPLGCRENVRQQINRIKNKKKISSPKKVLIIGSSTGYGLATRIVSTYLGDASTIGVMYEKMPNERRTATPGWYNTKAYEEIAKSDGYYAETINGDAFSKTVKEEVIQLIKKDLGKIDMVIYSLAAPRRTLEDGTTVQSVLKPISKSFSEKSWDLSKNLITEKTIMPASEDEIRSTIKVMGGEDWYQWMEALTKADVLEKGTITVAYSYIGSELTYPIYYDGTIGMAKKDLHKTTELINHNFLHNDIKAYISVNKAVVTQASGAIPIVPLYFAILYKVMKEHGLHENCLDQIKRLYQKKLFGNKVNTDKNGLIRLDDYELLDVVQDEVKRRWKLINSNNMHALADIDGYWHDFYRMYGFDVNYVNYEDDVLIM